MICIAIGLGVLGFYAARKARGCGGGYHGYGWHHHHHHGWHHRGWHRHGCHRRGFGRRGLYMALARLDASPAQERAIVAEVDRLHERLHAAKAGLVDGRTDLAAAVRGPVLDDAALGAVLGRIDGATAEARSAAIEAVRNIHATLDDKQRAHLADLLEGGWWRGVAPSGGGPYRV
jgi:uncharacterized membrane protein